MTFAENRSRWIIHELVVYVALVCIIHITTMEICSIFVTLVPKTVHRWPCNMSKKIDACLWLVFYFTQADPNLLWKLWNAYSTEVFWIFFNFFCNNRCKKSQLIMRSCSNISKYRQRQAQSTWQSINEFLYFNQAEPQKTLECL